MFAKLIRLISKHYHIVVVNNSADANAKCVDDIHHDSIVGTNKGWEFSAWDEAIEHIRSTKVVDDDAIYIFANDTFCHNRKFTIFNLILFAYQIRLLRSNSAKLIGELCRISTPYNIGGLNSSGWISTYLFATSSNGVKLLYPFDKANMVLKSTPIDYIDIENQKVNLPGSDDIVNQHLSNWLFPTAHGHGWYKVKNNTTNPDLMRKKLMAIFNEKYLSACAENFGYVLTSVYKNPIIRKINYLHNRYLK
jgi:hypothetical protein